MMIATIRWLPPALILWSLARPKIQNDWPTVRERWGIMLWLGTTGGILFSALQYIGLKYTTALNASILNSLVPVLIIALGALIFRDPIRSLQLLGIASSFVGVLTILTGGGTAVLWNLQFNPGDLIVVFTMTVFAMYAAYLRVRPVMHWLSFLFFIAVISTAGTLPFAVFEFASGERVNLTWWTVAAALYVGIAPSLLAFAAWNRGVELIGPNRAGPFLHFVPLYTALLGTALLGERLMGFHVLGLLLILVGVWLAVKPSSSRARHSFPHGDTKT